MAGVARIRWWQWIPWPWRGWRVIATVDAGDEIPASLPYKSAILVSLGGTPTWIAFDCPCRRGHRIMLNLYPGRSPAWALQAHRRLTLSPSVDDSTRDRRCHFFLRRGRVEWAPNGRRHDT